MKKLNVYIEGRFRGELTQSDFGNLEFAYVDGDRSLTPLSLSMREVETVYRKRTVLPFLQGLFPDHPGALAAFARLVGANSVQPFALLEKTGIEVAGAVEFFPDENNGVSEGFTTSPLSHEQIGRQLEEVLAVYADQNQNFFSFPRLSLAGAQPKIALHRMPDGTWAVPTRDLASTHIVKPVTQTLRDIDVIEFLTMTAARTVGLEVANSELVEFDNVRCFVSQRFDRQFRDGSLKRVHQEDFCQSLSVHPNKKYQMDGGPGVSAVKRIAQEILNVDQRTALLQRFFRAFVFNSLAGCSDAHAKNYSLLLDRENVRLTPLYDLSTTLAFPFIQQVSAMSVNSKWRFDSFRLKDFLVEGVRMGLEADFCTSVVRETESNIVQAFEQAAVEMARYELSGESAKMVSQAVQAVTDLRRNSPLEP